MQPVQSKVGGMLLTALFLAIAVMVFVGLYLAFPQDQHYNALVLIGVISLILAVVSYLAESFSREPTAQRSLAWGFFGMGFSVLFLTVGLGPYYVSSITAADQLFGLIILAVLLAVSVALIVWRVRAVRATRNQMVSRGSWQREPAPSAFSYGAANSPSVPIVAPPPASPPSNPPRSP
ncbi:MAG TPA: hypothetical protein VK423_06565 [Thermoplasmata archaeon]|nr:hypothetical protein [Thermoplasmata archaeon]